MKEEWLMSGAVVPVDVETTAALVAEIKRLIDVVGGMALAQVEMEPLEYWNAVEGWVKIDEVRKHFDAVGCGTIYKTAGEDRVPLYTAPPQRPWVGLTDEEILSTDPWEILRADPRFGKSESDVNPYQILGSARDLEAKLKERNT